MTHLRLVPSILAPALALGLVQAAACSGDDGRGEGSATAATTVTTGTAGTTTDGATTTGEGTTASGSGSGSESEGTSAGTTTDESTSSSGTTAVTGATTTTSSTTDVTTGTTDDSSSTGEPGCKRVDFMFVIDNSVSMEGEQDNLKAAFPAFIATIKDTLPTDDYHIMVVDTDATGRCSPQTCTHATCQAANKYACMDIFEMCDNIRGAGVRHPAGDYASNMPCPFPDAYRFVSSSDPNLVSNFQCAASVGTAGNASERPMDGMVEAVSPALLGPGGCNEGFLRDDAILVVTFISDDPNVEDQNSAQETFDALVAAKNGDTDRIVMLGLIPPTCGNGGKHWEELISLFGPRGIQGPVCADDYNTFFQDAVSTILDTCVINPG